MAQSTIPNPVRMHFNDRADSEKMLAACLDAEWKLVFSLCRFGGLRCPSELVLLRWSDIHRDALTMTVSSPKTEHHFGKGTREVPIFPELLPHLEECFRRRKVEKEYVVARYRSPDVNLRSRMLKTIRRAGLQPWPKLFQNLRSSRETELENVFPGHVVCTWLGNSERVKQKHYLQVTPDHIAAAIKTLTEKVAISSAEPPGMPGRTAEATWTGSLVDSRRCSKSK